jgi:hypothetical protein
MMGDIPEKYLHLACRDPACGENVALRAAPKVQPFALRAAPKVQPT